MKLVRCMSRDATTAPCGEGFHFGVPVLLVLEIQEKPVPGRFKLGMEKLASRRAVRELSPLRAILGWGGSCATLRREKGRSCLGPSVGPSVLQSLFSLHLRFLCVFPREGAGCRRVHEALESRCGAGWFWIWSLPAGLL